MSELFKQLSLQSLPIEIIINIVHVMLYGEEMKKIKKINKIKILYCLNIEQEANIRSLILTSKKFYLILSICNIDITHKEYYKKSCLNMSMTGSCLSPVKIFLNHSNAFVEKDNVDACIEKQSTIIDYKCWPNHNTKLYFRDMYMQKVFNNLCE